MVVSTIGWIVPLVNLLAIASNSRDTRVASLSSRDRRAVSDVLGANESRPEGVPHHSLR